MAAVRAGLASLAVLALVLVACADGDKASNDTPADAIPGDVIAFGGQEDGSFGLYLIKPDGSDLRQLTREEGFVYFPRWSPQGDRIAYVAASDTDPAVGQLRVVDAVTGEVLTLSEQAVIFLAGPAMSWSPDADLLAFAELEDTAVLRIADAETGTVLDTPRVEGIAPDWSPTDDELALVSAPGGAAESDVYAANRDGTNLRPIVEHPGQDSSPRWSPDGRQIAFSGQATEDAPAEAFVVGRDGSGLRKVGDGVSPVWSPDGRRIAFTGPSANETDGASDGELDVFVLTVDGGTPESVSGSATRDGWPSWSPSGDRLVYLALADIQTGFLCVVDVDSGDSNCFDPGAVVPSAPAWSPR